MISAYNQPEFIRCAVLAAVNQTLPFHQILVIDDHSTDATIDVLHALKAQFPQIELIEKDTNHGVSHSRNLALESVRGDFIWFTDGDDTIEPNAHEELQSLLADGQADIAVFGYRQTMETASANSIKKQLKTFDPTPLDFGCPKSSTDLARVVSYPPPAWLKICRVDFLRDNKIVFENYVMEDILWNFKAILTAKKIYTTPKVLINYRVHDASSQRSCHRAFVGILDLWKAVMRFADNQKNLAPVIVDTLERLQFVHLTGNVLETGRIPAPYLPDFARSVFEWCHKRPNLVSVEEFGAMQDVEKVASTNSRIAPQSPDSLQKLVRNQG